jgi:hypothetical protein
MLTHQQLDQWARALGDEMKARIEHLTRNAGAPETVGMVQILWPLDARTTEGAATFSTNLDTTDPETLDQIGELLEELGALLRKKASRKGRRPRVARKGRN